MAGFINFWHLTGPVDSGLVFNLSPNLFDDKIFGHGKDDPPEVWRDGCVPWNRTPLPLRRHPVLSLRRAAVEFPLWDELTKDIDTDSWDKSYHALAVIESPRESRARLWFSGWDGCCLWINGELLHDRHRYHHVIIDQEMVGFELKAGVNEIRLRLDRDGAVARVETPEDIGLIDELRCVVRGAVPESRSISTFDQLHGLAAGSEVENAFFGETSDEFNVWSDGFRGHLHRCLGVPPVSGSGDHELVATENEDGFVRRFFYLPVAGGGKMPCYVLIPEASRRNGRTIICPHGHNNRFKVVAGAEPPVGPRECLGEFKNDYAARLASAGFVTAAPCLRGFECRRDFRGPGDACAAASHRALALGHTLPMLHLSDIWTVADFLSGLDEVDSGRMGISGLSAGGVLSYLAGAYDNRFKAVGVFCGLCRYADYASGEGCMMQIAPGLYPHGDVGEILSLIAPRPLLLAQGRLDSTFNVPRLRGLAADTARAYAAAGAPDNLRVEVFEAAHEYEPELATEFFLENL